jgi:hypothetical protein
MPFDFLRRKRTSPDGQVIEQLRTHSDLSKPHEVEFFLYFPTRDAAEQAAQQIRPRGFDVNVEPGSPDSGKWLAFATKSMLPDLDEMEKIRSEFEDLAESLGGEYDGWGTAFVE